MERTCDNCKYWDDKPSTYPSDDPMIPDSAAEHHVCLRVVGYDGPHPADSMISYEMIGTGPKFGCVKFEAKGQ
jgi:hypothetical protein